MPIKKKKLKKYKKEGKANYFEIKHKTEIVLGLVHKTEPTTLSSLLHLLPQTFLGNQPQQGIVSYLCGRHHGCSARVTGSGERERQLWFGRTVIPNKAAPAFTAPGYLAGSAVLLALDGERRKRKCALGPSTQACHHYLSNTLLCVAPHWEGREITNSQK